MESLLSHIFLTRKRHFHIVNLNLLTGLFSFSAVVWSVSMHDLEYTITDH